MLKVLDTFAGIGGFSYGLEQTGHYQTATYSCTAPSPGRFSGSGSEMIGAMQSDWEDVTGIEKEAEYVKLAEARINHWTKAGHQPTFD